MSWVAILFGKFLAKNCAKAVIVWFFDLIPKNKIFKDIGKKVPILNDFDKIMGTSEKINLIFELYEIKIKFWSELVQIDMTIKA